MFESITTEQKKEIEKLARDHRDALVNFGADLHRSGIVKGVLIMTACGVITIGLCYGNVLMTKFIDET